MKLHYTHIFKRLAIIVAFALCLPVIGMAFILPDSTIAAAADSSVIKKIPFVKRVEVSLDYLKLFSLPSKFEKKAEAGTGFYLRNNFGLNFEIGYGRLTPQNAYMNSDYKSEGIYGRLGLNYLYQYLPGVWLYLGIKYGESHFSDQGSYTIQNPLWNDYTGSYKRNNLKADWSEIILGSESSWKGNFNLGFITRVRFLMDYPKFNDIDVYSIPGYGRTMDKSHLAINLYIKYFIGY